MLLRLSSLISRIPWSATRRWLPSSGNVIFTLLLLASLFFAGRAGALPGFEPAAPSGASTGLIAYQGRLTDAAGVPLTGSYPMTFALYTAPTGGSALWSESRTVDAADGVFSVMLGEVTPIPASLAANTSLYLGVKVGSDSEMTPRKQLGSAPYALQAPFGGKAHSFPFLIGIQRAGHNQSSLCNGYAPGEEMPGYGLCELGNITHGFFMPAILGHSATGEVNAANNLGYSDKVARWGYGYAFFLHNSGSARTLNLTVSTCNDVMIYRFDGPAAPADFGATGSLLYHRTPGAGDGGRNCPCADLNPPITIPAGDSRLIFLTRGSDCTSYLRLPVGWITANGLSIDWDNLRTYLGEY